MSWDERYQVGDTPWDKGAPAPPLLDLLREHPEYFQKGSVMVPGCGRGHDSLAIAEAGFPAIGLDISPTALTQAKKLDLDSKVRYEETDFLTLSRDQYPETTTVFEHTCFCAITPNLREAYRESCSRIIPSGGYWVAIIFLTPREEDDPTIGPPFQSKEEEIHSLFGVEFTLLESFIPKSAYTGRKGKELVMIWQRN